MLLSYFGYQNNVTLSLRELVTLKKSRFLISDKMRLVERLGGIIGREERIYGREDKILSLKRAMLAYCSNLLRNALR